MKSQATPLGYLAVNWPIGWQQLNAKKVFKPTRKTEPTLEAKNTTRWMMF